MFSTRTGLFWDTNMAGRRFTVLGHQDGRRDDMRKRSILRLRRERVVVVSKCTMGVF